MAPGKLLESEILIAKPTNPVRDVKKCRSRYAGKGIETELNSSKFHLQPEEQSSRRYPRRRMIRNYK